ncbi:OmpA family protein [Pseudogemmobacter sonorensis]|uniref:OmpA family protein n=1 Tax=Pseudogemmobacter sonorensis TaxID=2989681 RepID=UPI0036C87BFE
MRHRLSHRTAALCLALALPWPGRIGAETLEFPFPVVEVTSEPAIFGGYRLPVAGFRDGILPVRVVEGMIDRRAFRLDAPGMPLLTVLAPLRSQLRAAGYEVILDCETRDCGGFDFRFATEVMAEPGMHVDLGEFRFLSALREGEAGAEAIGLLVSRSALSAFVQVISVGPEALAPTPPAPGAHGALSPPPPPSDPAGLAARLDQGLSVALDDLVFGSGAAGLAGGEYASLTALAAWLRADPARRVILVGHTDVSGGLEANVNLSKRRAEAVRMLMVQSLGVSGAQISAEGVGPLAPRASNLTEEGRHRNRRVEAIPAPT